MRLLPLFALLLLVSCQPQVSSGKRTLRVNLFAEPGSIDPRLADGMGGNTVALELFEGLTRIDANGEASLALAEKVEVSDRGCHYTFTLRPSKWSNGEPLYADDFVHSWKGSLDPNFPCDFAFLLFEIEGARAAKLGEGSLDDVGVWADGPYTLHVQLAHPAPYFLHLTTNSMYLPVNRRAIEKNPHWAGKAGPDFIGNGPFKLVAWEHNSEIVVEKNSHYWDADNVAIDQIHHAIIDSSTTEITMFEQGELDWAGGPMSMLPYDALPVLRERFGVGAFKVDAVYWYQLNTSDPLLQNAKIRRALAYSLCRKELSESLAKSAHRPATGFLPTDLAPTSIDYLGGRSDSEVRALFDEGLSELGIARDQMQRLTISINIADDHLKLAQALQQRWHEMFGLTSQIEVTEWKVHVGKMHQGLYQVGRYGYYANYHDGIDFLNRFRYLPCQKPAVGWDHARFAALVDQIDWCTDGEMRQKLIAEGEALLMEEMPIIPLFFLNFNYIKHPNLEGVVFSPFGRLDFRWAFWSNSV